MLPTANDKIPGNEKQSLEVEIGPQMISDNIAGQSSLQKMVVNTTEFLLSWGVETHG